MAVSQMEHAMQRPSCEQATFRICFSAEALTDCQWLPILFWLTHVESLQAWANSRQDTRISYLQRAVCRTLREAGLEVQMEYNEGFFSVDTALFLPPRSPGGKPRKVRTHEKRTGSRNG